MASKGNTVTQQLKVWGTRCITGGYDPLALLVIGQAVKQVGCLTQGQLIRALDRPSREMLAAAAVDAVKRVFLHEDYEVKTDEPTVARPDPTPGA